ncbi:hypothetical protein Sjap_006204 [Stephania japonica]|uniref:Protein kinase domain-containing protein n=1 Tax=Stephania japonica TaxID=461633 RepID=A0AAP0K5K6_9MAGN
MVYKSALESTRGLEYIQKHNIPIYIYQDIKSANILLDKNFHEKALRPTSRPGMEALACGDPYHADCQ